MKAGLAGRSRATLARSPGPSVPRLLQSPYAFGDRGLGPQHRVRDEVRRQVHLRGWDPLDPHPGEELGAGVLREVDRGRPLERLSADFFFCQL